MSKAVSFLPAGLTLRKIVRPPKWITICQRRADGPAWELELQYMSYPSFKASAMEAAKLRERSTKPEEAEVASFKPLLEKVVTNWRGATLANINYVRRAENVIRPEDDGSEAAQKFNEEYVEGNKEFDFHPGFVLDLWFSSYPERFPNPIFDALKDWEDEAKLEVVQGKGA